MSTIVIVSGYFDPIHSGHIEYFEKASQLGDFMIAILNNDQQAKLKKGYSFMNEQERLIILKEIRLIDNVYLSIDNDKSVCKTLEYIRKLYPKNRLFFAKGGDRHKGEIPEAQTCKKLNIEIVDGLGKKIQSSSDLIGRYKTLVGQTNKA
jgi:cytidyltransferase-like protein